jgi:hypothetical protein
MRNTNIVSLFKYFKLSVKRNIPRNPFLRTKLALDPKETVLVQYNPQDEQIT